MRNKNIGARYFLISFLITFTLVTLFGVLSFFGSPTNDVIKTESDVEKPSPTTLKSFTALLIGEGESEKAYSILHFSEKDGAVHVFSLPEKMSLGERNISDTQKYGGAQSLCEQLSNVLEIEIDAYVRINKRGFIKLLDTTDVLYLSTERDVNYFSPDGYTFSLSKGEHILSFEKVYDTMRFFSENISEKMNFQSKVICDIITQKITNEKLPDPTDFFNLAVNIVDTNINAFDFATYEPSIRTFLENPKANVVALNFDGDFSILDEEMNKISLLFQ